MFKTKPHISESITKRQNGRIILDIAASGPDIPLKTVDWANRWCTFPTKSEEYFQQIYEFAVRNDDVFVVTFPKAGTTWIQEVTWLLTHDLDYATAISDNLTSRSPFLDLSAIHLSPECNTVDSAGKTTSPRVLKTHFPAHLIPKQIWEKRSKIIYCARNPKDTVVSYYHFYEGIGTWNGTIDEFVEDFVSNDIMYTPYWEHVTDFWQMRNEDNIFFTTYEEMKRDLKEVLVKLNIFLEKPKLTDEDLKKLEQHVSFDNMKVNCYTNPTSNFKSGLWSSRIKSNFQFMRRGIVGSYKDELSPDTQEKLDKWIEANLRKYNIKLQDVFGKF